VAGGEEQDCPSRSIERRQEVAAKDDLHHGRPRRDRGRDYALHLRQQLRHRPFQPKLPIDGRKDKIRVHLRRVPARNQRPQYFEKVQAIEDPRVQGLLCKLFAADSTSRESTKLEDPQHRATGKPHFPLHFPEGFRHLSLPRHRASQPRGHQGL
jgi:hypothetical protein